MRWHWGWANKAAANHTSNLQQKKLKTDLPKKNPEHLVFWAKPPTKTWIYHRIHVNVPYFFPGSIVVQSTPRKFDMEIYVLFQNDFFPVQKVYCFRIHVTGIVSISISIYVYSYVYVCIQVFNVWLSCLHLGSLADKGRSILRTYIVLLYIINIVNQKHVGKTDQSSSPNCGTVQCLK